MVYHVKLVFLLLLATSACQGGGHETTPSAFTTSQDARFVDSSIADMATSQSPLTSIKKDSETYRFVDWLEHHPEVTVASLLHKHPVSRARYSDSNGTVLCGAQNGSAVCIRNPAIVRFASDLSYRRRPDGHPALSIGLGPLPDGKGVAYELYFPEATALLRGGYRFQQVPKGDYVPYWAASISSLVPATKPSPANGKLLPTVPAPDWVTYAKLSVSVVGTGLEPIVLDIQEENMSGLVFCRHTSTRWQCFSATMPDLSEIEPTLEPGDIRLKHQPPFPINASVVCENDDACSVMVEWVWEREIVAHSYMTGGTFVTLYQTQNGRPARLAGTLRNGTTAMASGHYRRAHLPPKLIDGRCVELQPIDPRKFYDGRRAMGMLPSPGQHCTDTDGTGFTGAGSQSPVTW